jgi:hypothetical protein
MNTQTNVFETLGEILKPEPGILAHLQGQAIRAHYWTSFDPEKRGQQLIKDYNEQLTEDIKELETAGIDPETIDSYKKRYESLFTSWLSAKSRTFSAMITGPAKFPTRRHEKANRSEENHYTVFQEWRQRAKRAIIRKAQPVKTYTSELERYREELAAMQRNHELMKEGNKRIKAANKSGENLTQYLTDTFKIAPHMIEHTMRWGFGLTNNNANMKRVEDMIKTLEKKEAMKAENPITRYSFDGGEFVVNYEVDRIQIFFDPRPTKEELTAWKAKGLNSYNWSPTATAWQRKITANSLRDLKIMFERITKL